MRMLFKIITKVWTDDLPKAAAGQASPMCKRTGLVLGWTCAMRAVDDLLLDR